MLGEAGRSECTMPTKGRSGIDTRRSRADRVLVRKEGTASTHAAAELIVS